MARITEKVVPAMRVAEYAATLTPEQRERAASRKSAPGPFADMVVKVFKDRWLLARTVRGESRNATPNGWSPMVPLAAGEGY